MVELVFVLDLQINQCKVASSLLTFLFLTKVQSQLKIRTFRSSIVNLIKV